MAEGVPDPNSAGEATKGSWRDAVRGNVLAMGLVSLFTDFSSEMIYPLLPVFLAGLVAGEGMSDAEVLALAALYLGMMEGVAETTASVLKIFSGRISDRLGKRKALVMGGYGVSTVVRPLMGLAFAAWNVVALRFLDRIGKGVRTSPRDALIGDSVGPAHRGLAFGFHRAMDHTGAVLGPVVAFVILVVMVGNAELWSRQTVAGPEDMSSLRWLFGIALIPGLAAMAALVWKVRELAPSSAAGAAEEKTLRGWRDLPRRFFAFVGIVTLFALGNSSDLFLLLYGKTLYGFGMGALLALWVGLHLSKILFSIPGGILSDRLGRRPVIVAGWAIYALVYMGMAMLSPGGSPWSFVGLFVVYGFYYGMTEGVEKALVADFVPSSLRGTAYGVYHGAVGLAALPASLVFGLLWKTLNDAYGEGVGPHVAFGIGAALAGLAAVMLIVLLSVSPRKENASSTIG